MPKLKIESEINLQGLDDDITNFSDSEKVTLNHINFELEQANKLHGLHRKITIFNNTHCYQTIKNKHQRKYRYRVDIAFLEARPYRSRVIRWKWLWASLALLVLDVVLIFSGWLDITTTKFFGLFIGIAVASTICLLAFFYCIRDKVFFRSQYGKVKLIELINDNPNSSEFRSFVKRFCQQIIKSKTAKKYAQHKYLTCELQELRRLSNESIVPPKAYERAKRLIFKHKAFKNA